MWKATVNLPLGKTRTHTLALCSQQGYWPFSSTGTTSHAIPNAWDRLFHSVPNTWAPAHQHSQSVYEHAEAPVPFASCVETRVLAPLFPPLASSLHLFIVNGKAMVRYFCFAFFIWNPQKISASCFGPQTWSCSYSKCIDLKYTLPFGRFYNSDRNVSVERVINEKNKNKNIICQFWSKELFMRMQENGANFRQCWNSSSPCSPCAHLPEGCLTNFKDLW